MLLDSSKKGNGNNLVTNAQCEEMLDTEVNVFEEILK